MPSVCPSHPRLKLRIPPGRAIATQWTDFDRNDSTGPGILYPLEERLPLKVFQMFCSISDHMVLELFINAAKDPRMTIKFSMSLLSQEKITLPNGSRSGLHLQIRKEGLVWSSSNDRPYVISQKFLDVAFEMLYNSVNKEDHIVKTLRSVQLDGFRDLTSV